MYVIKNDKNYDAYNDENFILNSGMFIIRFCLLHFS
mgnify:CR=1 FL=1